MRTIYGKRSDKFYGNSLSFFSNISKIKRLEIKDLINNYLHKNFLKKKFSLLDVGTADNHPKDLVSNIIVKNIKNVNCLKILSIDKVQDKFFKNKFYGSITDILNKKKIKKLKSDIVISSATIEHVGSDENKIKMILNIQTLTNYFFFITTPNRNYPVDFHTKLPFIHLLNKKVHRLILRLLGFHILSKEENLDLLTKNDVLRILKKVKFKDDTFKYQIKNIKLFGIVSNFVIIGKKINSSN